MADDDAALRRQVSRLRLQVQDLQAQLDFLLMQGAGQLVEGAGARHDQLGLKARRLVLGDRIALPRVYDDWGVGKRFRGMWHQPHSLALTRPLRRRRQPDPDGILALLRDNPHPNLIRIHAWTDRTVIAGHVDGPVLSNRRPFTPAQWTGCFLDDPAARLRFSDIAAAIAHLHGLGLAYTDLCSFNILVQRLPDSVPVPVLIDPCSITWADPELRALDLRMLENLRAELDADFPGQLI